MSRLSLQLFGGFSARLDGQLITAFKSDKVRGLLAYLAVESDRVHRRDSLATLLWPDVLDSSARASLRAALYDLRKAIDDYHADPSYLLITRESVRFNPESDATLDVTQFAELVSNKDEGECLRGRLAGAVELYAGDFLAGFIVDGALPFDDWASMMREGLRRQLVEAQSRLVDLCAACGDFERALELARRLVKLEPWYEYVQRQLIRLLALDGQRSAALMQFEACCRTLMDELGVEPSVETLRLRDSIRDGEVSPPSAQRRRFRFKAAPIENPPVRTLRKQRHNLPAQMTRLIGRQTELGYIDAYLGDPGCRLLTLVGPGGIGKTRLALAAGESQLHRFRDGVFFVPLNAVKTPDGLAPAIAQAMGFDFYVPDFDTEIPAFPRSPKDQLIDYLRRKEVLLILDGAEHLLNDLHPDSIDHLMLALLTAAPQIKMLVTSRTRLQMQAEQLLTLDGLAVSTDLLGGRCQAPLSPAARLFLQGARRVQSGYSLSSAGNEAVEAICGMVRGVPLAILLAAAWVDVLSLSEIQGQLQGEEGIGLLAVDWSDVPARHRSIRSVFDSSWALLGPEEQRLFAALSVFRGRFTRQAAAAVTGASTRLLRSLIRKSMLQVDGERYSMHALMRQYAAEHLAEIPVVEISAYRNHAAYYLSFLGRWLEEVRGPRQVGALMEMDIEIDDARLAWNWFVTQDDGASVDRAVDALCWFYLCRSRNSEGMALCQSAVDHLQATESVGEGERLRVLAKVTYWQSRFAVDTEVEALIERVFALLAGAESHGTDVRREKAAALRHQSRLRTKADPLGAMRDLTESLVLFEAVGDRWEESITVGTLGEAALMAGKFRKAQAIFERQLSLARQLGDINTTALALHGLSDVARETGDYETASRLTEESLALFRQVGNSLATARALHRLGNQSLLRGEYDKALACYNEFGAIYEDLGKLPVRANTMRATVFMLTGRYSEALAKAEKTLEEVRSLGVIYLEAWNSMLLAGLALVEGAAEEAVAFGKASVEIYRALNLPWFLVFAGAFAGCACVRQDRLGEARGHFSEILRVGVELSSPHALDYGMPGLILLYVHEGQIERAVALHAFAVQVSAMGATPWFRDVVDPTYERAAAALPRAVVAAAEARGRSMDRDTWVAELLRDFAHP